MDKSLVEEKRVSRRTVRRWAAPVGAVALVLGWLLIGGAFQGQTSQAASVNGTPYVWGANYYGAFGNGTTTNSSVPLTVTLPGGVTATGIAGGNGYSLVLGSDSKVYGSGANGSGQLGNSTNITSTTPVAASLPSGVNATAVAAGWSHSLAIGSDGKLYAWGTNGSGQLGDNTTTDSNTPVVVLFPGGITPIAISAGSNFSLAIGSDGKIYAWGINSNAQLGTGSTATHITPFPTALPGGVTATAIAAGQSHGMAIGSDGKLYSWGANFTGQLGIGNTTAKVSPQVVLLPTGVSPTSISAKFNSSLASANDGNVYAWGSNNTGQFGNGTTNSTANTTPVLVSMPSGVGATKVALGWYHGSAIGTDGNLYTWGFNGSGQLGTGNTTDSLTPVVVSIPNGYTPTAISDGDYFSLAIFQPYEFSIENVSQAEGNSGTTSFVFTVTLNASLATTATVQYTTADNTATAPSDYTAASGTLTFAPGVVTQTITVQVNGDTTFEPDETFNVNLSNASGAALSNAQATGTILNDDRTASSTSLTSAPNPSVFGQSVSFTATVSPIAASGTVSFTEGSTFLGTATLVNGSAVFTTTTLGVGSHIVTATYLGDSSYFGSTSGSVTQVVQSLAEATTVSSGTDDGSGNTPGTFSYALKSATFASGPITITFDSIPNNTIVFTASLTVPVPVGVTLKGGDFPGSSRVILDGNGVAGDGLHLGGQNTLLNLTIEHFGGQEVVTDGPGNIFQGVTAIS